MTIRFRAHSILALFFLGAFLIAIRSGWEWPYIAKLMPVYVAAIPGLILCLAQLYRDLTGWEGGGRQSQGVEMDEVYEVKLDKKTEIQRTLAFFAWFGGGAVAVWLLGIVIGLPLLILLYCRIEGREKWTTSLIMGACTFALIWGLFEYLLGMRWPPGALLR